MSDDIARVTKVRAIGDRVLRIRHGLFEERRAAARRSHRLPGAGSRQAYPGSPLCAGAENDPTGRMIEINARLCSLAAR